MSGPLIVASLADAVSPCPPGFNPSHHGCRFNPSEALVAGGLLGLAAVIAAVIVVLRKKDKGP